MKKNINNKKGFSLVEVLIAIGIMGIMMIGVAQLFIYAMWINRYVRETSNLSNITQYFVESLRGAYIDGDVTPVELATNSAEFQSAFDSDGLTLNDFKTMLSSRHAAIVLRQESDEAPINYLNGTEAVAKLNAGYEPAAWVYWFVEPEYFGNGLEVTIHARTGYLHGLSVASTPLIAKASVRYSVVIPHPKFYSGG